MVRIGLLVVVIAALGGVTGWFFSRPPPAPSSNVMNQAHAPTHGPKPEEAAAVDEEEAVVKEELPLLEHGVSPSLKHLLLFAADGCAKRVRFWTAKEQLFATDLRLSKGADGVTASVLRDVTKHFAEVRELKRKLAESGHAGSGAKT